MSSGTGATGGTFGSAGSAFGTGGSAGSGYPPAVCGDGSVGWPESCDDGNTTSGDGCDSTCQTEPNYVCNWGEPCRQVVCGDGFADYLYNADGTYTYEQCDDGNVASGDGCSSTCMPEVGFICSYPGTACKRVVCGDGSQDEYVASIETGSGAGGSGGTSATGGSAGSGIIGGAGGGSSEPYAVYGYEACDDGNAVSGDGCSATCGIEAGYVCDYPGQPCRIPRCGDGHLDFIAGTGGAGGTGGMFGAGGMGMAGGSSYGSYEDCDDGNTLSGDGCSATCGIEAGYSCPDAGSPCKRAVCGDGVTDWPVESCDDGNLQSGDGCDSECQYEFLGSGGSAGSGSFGAGGLGTGGTGIPASGAGGTGGSGARAAGH